MAKGHFPAVTGDLGRCSVLAEPSPAEICSGGCLPSSSARLRGELLCQGWAGAAAPAGWRWQRPVVTAGAVPGELAKSQPLHPLLPGAALTVPKPEPRGWGAVLVPGMGPQGSCWAEGARDTRGSMAQGICGDRDPVALGTENAEDGGAARWLRAPLWVPAEPEVTADTVPSAMGTRPPGGSAIPGLFFLTLLCRVGETEAPALPAAGLGCPECSGQGSEHPWHSLALPPAFPQPPSPPHPSPACFPRDFSSKGAAEPRCGGRSAPGPAGHKDGLIEWPGLAGNKRPLVSRWGGRGDNGDPGAGRAPPELGGQRWGLGRPTVSSLRDGKGLKMWDV